MIYSEIEYVNENGISIHSDLLNKEITEEYRHILHKALDEWLDNANNTGSFYVKGDNS